MKTQAERLINYQENMLRQIKREDLDAYEPWDWFDFLHGVEATWVQDDDELYVGNREVTFSDGSRARWDKLKKSWSVI